MDHGHGDLNRSLYDCLNSLPEWIGQTKSKLFVDLFLVPPKNMKFNSKSE